MIVRQIKYILLLRDADDESDLNFEKLQFPEGALQLFAFVVVIASNQLYTCTSF